MHYRVLADLVVLLHFAFIVFVLFGGLLALRWRWVPWAHLPAVIWGAAAELCGWLCPLTPLENALRSASGSEGYMGGFIEHYLVPVIYPSGLTRGLQLWLGCGVVVVNLGVYAWVWHRGRHRGVRGRRLDPR